MTALPDPAELAPTGDQTSPGRTPLMSRSFWAMIGFGAICIVAAVVVTLMGPRLWPIHRAAAPAPPPVAAPLPRAVEDPVSAPPAPAPPESQLALLQGRVARLEVSQDRVRDAASEALAAASLSDVASLPGPFAEALSAYDRVLPESADVASLRALALQGAPTRAALGLEFAQIAARIAVEAHAPGPHAGFLSRLGYALSRVVTIRRLDPRGAGPDAVLVRAQRLADDGDLAGAVRTLDSEMPVAARPAFQAWRERALRRIAIDEAIAGLRRQAVADLAAARQSRP